MPDRADQLGHYLDDRVLPALTPPELAVWQLRGQGRHVPDEILAHISPAHSENINFFGVITVDVEAELAKLDPAGWRPLRPAAPDLSLLL